MCVGGWVCVGVCVSCAYVCMCVRACVYVCVRVRACMRVCVCKFGTPKNASLMLEPPFNITVQ